MRIPLALIMWMVPLLGIIGLSGCDGYGRPDPLSDPQELAREKQFDHEAVLVKICGVDRGISTVPLKVYRLDGHLWFKDNLVLRQVAAELDEVCDVLDIDAQAGYRRWHRDGYGQRQWFTLRLRG
jgi:hypothetical protein